jgi:hypothetical protein
LPTYSFAELTTASINGVILRHARGKNWRLSDEVERLGAGPREDS